MIPDAPYVKIKQNMEYNVIIIAQKIAILTQIKENVIKIQEIAFLV